MSTETFDSLKGNINIKIQELTGTPESGEIISQLQILLTNVSKLEDKVSTLKALPLTNLDGEKKTTVNNLRNSIEKLHLKTIQKKFDELVKFQDNRVNEAKIADLNKQVEQLSDIVTQTNENIKETTNTANISISAETSVEGTGSGSKYLSKYIKYKNKYLKLRDNLNS